MQSAYSFDATKFRLGTMCKRGHEWRSSGQSLRRSCRGGGCVECERLRLRPTDSVKQEHWRQYRREYKKAYRAKLIDQGLTTRGKERINAAQRSEQSILNKAIKAAGRSPSVARLVMNEQLRYWKENPGAKAGHDRQWAQWSWWLEYQTKPDLRLYHREKSKRRKAQNRGQTPVQVSVSALRQRFNDFSNCCAYCGLDGDMQIEHVVPISKGGAHDIGNIIPACMSCNFSKRSKPMAEWYKNQSFFSELRLRKIQNALKPPSADQLAFAIAYNH